MAKKIFNIVFGIIFIISIFMIVVERVEISGNIVQDTVSNVSVTNSIAMGFSNGLKGGINFGSVNYLPAVNIDAEYNYNETNSNYTEYYVLVSSDGNSPMDLCIYASTGLMTLGGDLIDIDKETYAYSVDFVNGTIPSLSDEISLTNSYVLAGGNIPQGGNNYLRFWLDIPAGQASGEYSNSIYFQGTIAGAGC
jgi:hypothetical protein